MPDLPTQFMGQEPTGFDSGLERLPDSMLMQARLAAQTIERFRALNYEIANISGLQQQEEAKAKLDALATNEYGNAWEVLRKPEIEVVPITIGGKTSKQLKNDLRMSGCEIINPADALMDAADFTTRSYPEPVVLISLLPSVLGFAAAPNTNQLFNRVRELGLELCPPEVGPHYCLQAATVPNGKVLIGMQKIYVDGGANILAVDQFGRNRRLLCKFQDPLIVWSPWDPILFRLPAKAAAPTGTTHE